MCGIAGFIDGRRDAGDVIDKMTGRMAHRGPDGAGKWMDDETGVTLGHRRLAILDLSPAGAQPMLSASGRYVIVYNGEIYNAEDIRAELLKAQPGLRLKGTSDTEIVLEAFERFGMEQTLGMMKGMFAIGLFDRKEKCLYLMRDRAGEKPLYYGFVQNHFVFASDLGALREYPPFADSKKTDRNALAAYMRYAFIPAPLSVYEGIYKLYPGTVLELRQPFTQYRIRSYWSMTEAAVRGWENPFEGSFEEACGRLEKLLEDAIRGQMRSDVPVGAFLSGGVDSPLIVSLMQKISASPVKTFTIGFEDEKYNEAEFAKEIAAHLGTDHTELYVSEQELLDVIPQLGGIFTEPFADSSQIPTFLVSKLAKSKVTVSLSGDAGDELFGGYNTYPKIEKLWRREKLVPKPFRSAAGRIMGALPYGRTPRGFRMRLSLRAAGVNELHEAVCYHTNYHGEHCVIADKTAADAPGMLCQSPLEEPLGDYVSNMMLKDMRMYHPDDILVKVDRAGMAVSLENRIPMLDVDVMEFAFSLPAGYKLCRTGAGVVTKRILKEILYRYVPKEMLDRPKKGFSVPLVRWLSEGKTHEWARETILDSRLARDGYFDKNAVNAMWKEFTEGKADAQMIWQILMAEAWYGNE